MARRCVTVYVSRSRWENRLDHCSVEVWSIGFEGGKLCYRLDAVVARTADHGVADSEARRLVRSAPHEYVIVRGGCGNSGRPSWATVRRLAGMTPDAPLYMVKDWAAENLT